MTSTSKTLFSSRKIPLGVRLFPFLAWGKTLTVQSMRADFLAGLTGAFIVLPQGVAFAMVAGLPSEYGLYTAMIPPVIAALFGSSRHLISGPTTAISIVVFTTLSPLAEPGTAAYISLALTLTFMAGVFQLAFGLARLGTVTNFVSHSVIVGFTAGAACLIATGQLKYALGIAIPGGTSFLGSWTIILGSTAHINGYETTVALVTLVIAFGLKAWRPRWPGLLIALVAGSAVGILIDGQAHGMKVLGELSGTLPPLSSPDLSLETLRTLAPGALAIAMLGLIEALSIARSITVLSRQHINGNQEFVGQGLSNLVGSFFSSYASSGSFTRSSLNYDSGAVTPLSGIFSAGFLALIVLAVAPLTAWLPLSAMGAVILVVAIRLIDVRHIREIVTVSRAETLVLSTTFFGTLFFELEFAIYTGVFLSLAIYLTRTAHPRISVMTPDPADARRRLRETSGDQAASCPQLAILRIDGSLFFGAANHVSAFLENLDEDDPRHLLIVGYGINFIDIAGAMMLSQEAQRRLKMSKILYLCRVNPEVEDFLTHFGFTIHLPRSRIFPTEYEAIATIFSGLDRAICRTCTARIFTECQRLEPPETIER
jgi:SulP family sulfate permease